MIDPSSDIWPPEPTQQFPPEDNQAIKGKAGIAEWLSLLFAVTGSLLVIVTHCIAYSPPGIGYGTGPLYARVYWEFFTFGKFLMSGYLLATLGLISGILNRSSRSGRISIMIVIGFVTFEIFLRVVVGLLVPEPPPQLSSIQAINIVSCN